MTLVRANALFHRYLAVDPSLLSEASAFAAAHRLDASSIAVHAPAAGRAELEAQFETLRRLAGAAPHARILLVADSPEQVAFAHRSELAPRMAVYGGGEGADGYRKGAEALVALLLIAGCGVVVRTPSHLAAWSNILNLDQKVVMLTRPPDRFPDARVWRDRWEVSELARWMTQNLRFQSVHDL